MGPLLLWAEAGSPLQGQLHDDRGHPVPGAEIRVFAEIGERGLVQMGAPLELSHSTSSSDGTFRSTPLTLGRYRLRVQCAGYLALDQTIEVGRQALQPLQLVVDRVSVTSVTSVTRPASQSREQ